MPLTNPRWGDAVAAAIKALNITAGAPVTDTQLKAVWNAVKGEDITEITTNGVVATTVVGTLPTGPVAATGSGAIT